METKQQDKNKRSDDQWEKQTRQKQASVKESDPKLVHQVTTDG